MARDAGYMNISGSADEFGGKNISTKDWDAIVGLMNDDIREDLHRQGFADETEFFEAYCAAHYRKFGEAFEVAKVNPVW